jgi:hypothetical protein
MEAGVNLGTVEWDGPHEFMIFWSDFGVIFGQTMTNHIYQMGLSPNGGATRSMAIDDWEKWLFSARWFNMIQFGDLKSPSSVVFR